MQSTKHVLVAVALGTACGTAVAALDLSGVPRLKNGLWVTTVTNEGMAPTTHSICVDAAFQQRFLTMGQGAMTGLCAKSDLRREGDAFVFDSDCTVGPMRLRSSGRTTFTDNVAYSTVTTTQFDPPMMGRSSMRSVVKGQHSGACPEGMKPGDVKLPDGRVVNMSNLPALMGPQR